MTHLQAEHDMMRIFLDLKDIMFIMNMGITLYFLCRTPMRMTLKKN